MKKSALFLTTLSTLHFSTIISAYACLHYAKSYTWEIKEGTKQALIFHDGEFAHLVLSTDVRSLHPEGNKYNMSLALPNELSWIIPLPSLPVSYKELSKDFFKDIHEKVFPKPATDGSIRGAGGSKGAKDNSPKSIVVHEEEYAGNYTITPIEIKAEGSGEELNNWLRQKNFKEISNDIQKIYLKPGAVFLAITLKLTGKSANLKPIHITYKNDRAVFPLRLNHETRTFDVNVILATRKPVSSLKFYDLGINLERQTPINSKSGTSEFRAIVNPMKFSHLTLFAKYNVNNERDRVSRWKEDPTVGPEE